MHVVHHVLMVLASLITHALSQFTQQSLRNQEAHPEWGWEALKDEVHCLRYFEMSP